MAVIVPIGDGDGEVHALPVLICRILGNLGAAGLRPSKTALNAHGGGRLTSQLDLQGFLEIARGQKGCRGILVLADADRDCPKTMAPELAAWARELRLDVPVAIVVAKCNYEAWFLGSLASIAGQPLGDRPGVRGDANYEGDPEAATGTKGRLTNMMPKGRAYKETQDQLAMTRLMDLDLVRERCRSFRRLEKAVKELVEAIERGEATVTPEPRAKESTPRTPRARESRGRAGRGRR